MALTPRIVCLALVVTSASATAAAGQARNTGCDTTETLVACLSRLSSPARSARVVEAVKKADTAKKTETGLGDLPNGLSSATKNFLPLLEVSGLLGPAETDEKSGIVTVALNRLFPNTRGFQLRALINSKPTLYGPLRATLQDAREDATVKKLDADIAKGTNRPDATIEGSWLVTPLGQGRDLSAYRSLFDELFVAAARPLGDSALTQPAQELVKLLPEDMDGGTLFGLVPQEQRPAIELKIVELAAAHRAAESSVEAVLRTSGLHYFAQMVANQPQSIVTFSVAERAQLLGPKVRKVRVAHERAPGVDLVTFLKTVGGRQKCEGDGAACLRKLAEFVADPAKAAAIRQGQRFSAFLEVSWLDKDYEPLDTEGKSLGFKVARSPVWTGGLDWSRLLDVDEEGSASARFDASLRVDFRGAKDEKNRTVAAVTLTKKLGDVSVPVGLVWANRQSFLDPNAFDIGLSAHVGLKFSLFGGLK